MKKILLFLLLGLLPQLIHAQTAKAIWCSGNTTLYFTYDTNTYAAGGTYEGQTITDVYTINENISYSDNNIPWRNVRESVTTVVFADNFSAFSPTSMRLWFCNFKNLTTMTGFQNINTSSTNDISYLFMNCSNITSLEPLRNWNTSNVLYLNSVFDGCSSLTSLEPLSNWNTAKVTRLNNTFAGCSAITSLEPLRNWNTSKVTHLENTFYQCTSIVSLDPLQDWKTNNVTTILNLFGGCRNITSLEPLRNWDVDKVTIMAYAFQSCNSIVSLEPLQDWKTGNVTNMRCMFNQCHTITSSEPLRNWDTSKVTDMNTMFQSCYSLISLDGLRDWKISKVTDMSNMFYNCYNLTSLEPLRDWDVSNVTNMYSMFENCRTLTTVNLDNWNTGNVATMISMFGQCTSLISVTFGKNFSMDKVSGYYYSNSMFSGCSKLRYIDFFASDDTDAITLVNRSYQMFYGIPATTVIYLPHGSQYVTNAQNVVYSYNGDETDLRCPEYYSEDKVDIELPRDFKTHKAIYQRTMSNNYGSVILPYDFTTNDKVQAYTLDEEHTETMYFRDTQTVPAHTPFAFNVKQKGSGNVVDFTMADSSNNFGITVKATHTTHPDETCWDGVVGAPYSSNTNLTGWTAKGYYVNQTIEKTDPLYGDLHYIAGEKFYRAAGETLIFPPHRVTFHGAWTKGNTSGGAKSFVFAAGDDDVITAIEEAETRQMLRDAEAIYDLAGRRQHEAQKGVNIVRMKDGSVRKMFVK